MTRRRVFVAAALAGLSLAMVVVGWTATRRCCGAGPGRLAAVGCCAAGRVCPPGSCGAPVPVPGRP